MPSNKPLFDANEQTPLDDASFSLTDTQLVTLTELVATGEEPIPNRSATDLHLNSSERLQRWAELVAVGGTPLPAELNTAELRSVLMRVGRLRRKRLIRLVARAIARDIHGDGKRVGIDGANPNVKTRI